MLRVLNSTAVAVIAVTG
jgi:hypothetical protein